MFKKKDDTTAPAEALADDVLDAVNGGTEGELILNPSNGSSNTLDLNSQQNCLNNLVLNDSQH